MHKKYKENQSELLLVKKKVQKNIKKMKKK